MQPGKLPIKEKRYMTMVIGSANRSLLTREILDFCGALKILNTKRFSATSKGSGIASNLLLMITRLKSFIKTNGLTCC